LTLPVYFDNIKNVKIENVVRSLAALAQATRLDIFRLLVQKGPPGLAASAIAAKLDLPNATLSFHIKELNQAGLVTARQDGRFIFYSANYPAVNALVAYLTQNCCGGAACEASVEPIKSPRRKSA